jgi:hypothetical protein
MDWQIALNVVGFIGLGLIGYFWLRSGTVKQNVAETQQLAITRGERIVDLEAEVHRLAERLSRVEGQMEAIQRLKAQEIAVEVVALLRRADVAVSPTEGL